MPCTPPSGILPLEPRLLLAADEIIVTERELRVQGHQDQNTFRFVEEDGTFRIRLNDTVKRYTTGDFDKIRVSLLGSQDTAEVKLTQGNHRVKLGSPGDLSFFNSSTYQLITSGVHQTTVVAKPSLGDHVRFTGINSFPARPLQATVGHQGIHIRFPSQTNALISAKGFDRYTLIDPKGLNPIPAADVADYALKNDHIQINLNHPDHEKLFAAPGTLLLKNPDAIVIAKGFNATTIRPGPSQSLDRITLNDDHGWDDLRVTPKTLTLDSQDAHLRILKPRPGARLASVTFTGEIGHESIHITPGRNSATPTFNPDRIDWRPNQTRYVFSQMERVVLDLPGQPSAPAFEDDLLTYDLVIT